MTDSTAHDPDDMIDLELYLVHDEDSETMAHLTDNVLTDDNDHFLIAFDE